MNELPQGWALKTIGNVVTPFRSIDPNREPDREFTYIDIGAIDNATQTITTPKTFLGRDAPSRARRLVKAGDILFSTVRTYLKNIAMVSDDLDGAVASTGIAILRPSPEVDGRYLFHWVRCEPFISGISEAQDGTMYPAIRDSDLGEAPIVLPPLSEQRRIVAKLDSLLASSKSARDELDHIPKLVRRFSQSVLGEAFGDEATRHWKGGVVEDRLQEGLIGLVRSKAEQGTTGRVPYIRMNHYDLTGGWNFDDLTYVTISPGEMARYELCTGDVLFNTRNSNELVGKVAIWPKDQGGYVYNNNLLRMRFKPYVRPDFAALYMISPPFRDYLETVKSATTSVAAIYQRNLYRAPFPIPDLATQDQLVKSVRLALSRVQALAAESRRAEVLLSRLDQAVLAKAFSGELFAPKVIAASQAAMAAE